MKKILLSLFIIVGLFIVSNNVEAAYTKSISADPILLFQNNIISLRYEKMLTKRNSISFDFEYDDNYSNVAGFRVGALYRWYLRDIFPIRTSGINGFSVGPFATLGLYSFDNQGTKTTENTFYMEVGGEAAYKWVFSNFQLEPSIKIGLPVVKESYQEDFNWGFGIKLGYAW